MNRFPLRSLLATAMVTCVASCASTSSSSLLDARTQGVLDAMSTKLAAAQTLRFTGTRTAPSGFHAAVDFGENTRMTGALRRPNKIVVNFSSAEGGRVLGYNGSELVLIDLKAGNHVRVPAPPTGEAVLRSMDASYNFIPPAAEFLVGNPEAYLLEGVTSVRYVGQESVGGVVCDHIFFDQKTRTRDLWVAQSDHLPRRITITYPNGTATPEAITTTIHEWRINAPVSDDDLAFKIPANSVKVESVRLRR